MARDLSENLIKTFSCFGPKFNLEWEALLFAWHYLHDALGSTDMAFAPEKLVTGLPQCTTCCLSHSWHDQSRLGSSTGSISLGESTWFSLLPLTADQRQSEGKEAWGDGSKVGTTCEEEGKENTEPCWKSSFHKCEIITWVFSKCSCQIPRLDYFLRVDGIYCCVNFYLY